MTEHKQVTCSIISSQWYNYFSSLLNKEPCVDSDFELYFEQSIQKHNNMCEVCEADEPNKAVDLDELVKCVKSFPNGKAAGVNGVLYEMLKASLPKTGMLLVKFFNLILEKGQFPEEWTKGMICTFA